MMQKGAKMKTALEISFLATLMLFFPLSLTAAPAGMKHQLTPTQVDGLKATKRKIIYPQYLPQGFQLKEVKVDRKYPETPNYSLWFTGPQNTCFFVEMGTEVGDLIVQDKKGNEVPRTSALKNPRLGETSFWNSPYYLGTDWFPPFHETAYKLSGDVSVSDFARDPSAASQCKGRMNSAELIKVGESLGVLE